MSALPRDGSASSASNFERDPRRKQEVAGRPIADAIYYNVFGDDIQIVRMEREEQKVLDIEFAIDAKIVLPTGHILLGQEKFLSQSYAKYRSVTVEYEQNQFTGEPGDWFKLAPQFYFVGYFTKDGLCFDPWIILNWPNTVLATLQEQVYWQDNANRDGRARASFRFCTMEAFPRQCVIASSFARQLTLDRIVQICNRP